MVPKSELFRSVRSVRIDPGWRPQSRAFGASLRTCPGYGLAAKYPYDATYLPVARLEDGTLTNW
jgi:hypothetical protein